MVVTDQNYIHYGILLQSENHCFHSLLLLQPVAVFCITNHQNTPSNTTLNVT